MTGLVKSAYWLGPGKNKFGRAQALLRQVAKENLGKWPLMAAVFFSIVALFGGATGGAAEGSALRQIIWGVIGLSALIPIVRGGADSWRVIKSINPWLWVVYGYVAMTILWSPFPNVSLKRFVLLGIVTAVAIAMMASGNPRGRMIEFLRPVLIILILLNVLVVAAWPARGLVQGAMIGTTATKNNFGQFALLATLVWAFSIRKARFPWVSGVLLLVCIAGLVASLSLTSIGILVLLLCIGIFVALRRLLGHRFAAAALGTAILLLITLHVLYLVYGLPTVWHMEREMVGLTGRDFTLSGREQLWRLMAAEISRHPWFGAGYGGFWVGEEGRSGLMLAKVKWGRPNQAHNGYLDLVNEVGAVGMALVVVFLFGHARRVFEIIKIEPERGAFHFAILVSVIVMNITEAALLRQTHFWWLIFVCSVVEVSFISATRGHTDDLALRQALTRDSRRWPNDQKRAS